MNINDLKQEINLYLKNYFNDRDDYNKLIYDAQSYSLNIGGKRVRPILALLTYNCYKEDLDKALKMACAIEMIHTYSLIHDDLPCMDDDDLRRGEPTNHKVYGEGIAVLAGDALLNEAMILLMENGIDNGLKGLKASLEISKASGAEGMIGGQVVDIISEGKNISIDELKYMHLKKTGELIRASIVSGAILGEAPKEDIELLNEFGEKLGLVFQIKDDLLDVVGNEQKLGKKVHADMEKDKTNFVSVYGIEECKKMCGKITDECIELLKNLTVNSDNLIELTKNLLKREF
ncbi:polyprenyl synthetase family protein [Eubacterium multiforme]|uniref:Geranylgeranyl diphosphate synthase type II n=1 Tax=Eubacterium multiforme TaxID=83339 RepID=A0ABT9USF9_9FIRM|nr:farnesyl diphosphate synthase [Eubacterium multiforme]MDQ0149256.1 geranylgeranyl diphosphate synthase type II [Eubacterium multiforme]